ncbi:hypothetical protein GCM10020255_008810 [Rhodococcus baikonurensis]
MSLYLLFVDDQPLRVGHRERLTADSDQGQLATRTEYRQCLLLHHAHAGEIEGMVKAATSGRLHQLVDEVRSCGVECDVGANRERTFPSDW